MKCREVALGFATYRDLDEYERAEVQLHLHGCPSCRALQDTFNRQDGLLTELPGLRTESFPLGPQPSVLSPR